METPISSGTATKVAECRHCFTRNARGIEYVFDDYQFEFLCDVCGKISIIGSTEKDHVNTLEDKAQTEKARDNRSRYERERQEEFDRFYKKRKEDLDELPDAITNFYDSRRPDFTKKEELRSQFRDEEKQFSTPR